MQTSRFSSLVIAAALAAPTLAFASKPSPEVGSSDAKSSAAEANTCVTLVNQTTLACKDWIERGLDLNCYGKVIAIDVNRAKAAGNLFKVDGKARWTLAGTCRMQLDTLRKQRAEKDAEMRAAESVGPKCKALAAALQTRCFDELGKAKLSSVCKKTMRTFGEASASDPEARCEFASGMLK